jgi:hypothetical protein
MIAAAGMAQMNELAGNDVMGGGAASSIGAGNRTFAVRAFTVQRYVCSSSFANCSR